MGGRTRGPGAHHDQRRQEIADAVLAVVADQGLAAVSLTSVAARAGVSAGRVQHYFPSKQQLLTAAFNRGNALNTARIRARLGQDLDTAAPRDVLTAVLVELIPHDEATTAQLRVRHAFGAQALSDPTIAARLRQMYADFHHQFAELLRRDQADGRVPTTYDADDTAAGLAAHAEGLAYYVLIGNVDPDAARRQIHAALDRIYSNHERRAR